MISVSLLRCGKSSISTFGFTFSWMNRGVPAPRIRPVLVVLAAPDELRVEVAALIGDLDGIAVVLRHHRRALGPGDIGAFGLAVGDGCDDLGFAGFWSLRQQSAHVLNGFVMVTPSICCPCRRSSL